MPIVLWQGGESLHAGLAGDRTAFASKIRFAKKKKKEVTKPTPSFPLLQWLMMLLGSSQQIILPYLY